MGGRCFSRISSALPNYLAWVLLYVFVYSVVCHYLATNLKEIIIKEAIYPSYVPSYSIGDNIS